jgi:hypothetical protein
VDYKYHFDTSRVFAVSICLLLRVIAKELYINDPASICPLLALELETFILVVVGDYLLSLVFSKD